MDTKIKRRDRIILSILISLVVLNTCLSVFYYYFINIFGGIGFYLILFLPTLISLVYLYDLKLDPLNQKLLFFFLLWFVVYVINIQFIENYQYANYILGIKFNEFTLQSLQVLCIIIIFLFFNTTNDLENLKRNILIIILISLIINAIISIRALLLYPNIMRDLSTGLNMTNYQQFKGVSNYYIIYSIAIILPLFYSSIKVVDKKNKYIFIFFIFFMFYFVYKAGFTIAMLSVILGIGIYLFLNTTNKTKIFLVSLVIVLLFIVFFFDEFVYNSLIYLSNVIRVSTISSRITQVANLVFLKDTSGDALGRFALYRYSLNAFKTSPLLGIFIYDRNYQLSNHSTILDLLGGTGIVGFIPYALFIWYSYRNSMIDITDPYFKKAITTSYLVFIFIALVNPIAYSLTIMLIFLFFLKFYPRYVNQL